MCGFAGEHRPGQRADVAAVEAMAATMAPRGPDGAGSWSAGPVALAHRRLKIIDLSEQGSQPLVDPHVGRTVAFNGCIYNHRELRAELERDGHRFFSTSDTEVIAKALPRAGATAASTASSGCSPSPSSSATAAGCCSRATASASSRCTSRTPAGRCASPPRCPALLAGGGIDTSIDPVALHHYLSWHGVVPPPHTILQGVRKLPPATLLVVEPDGRRTQERYWRRRTSRVAGAGALGRARLAGRAARRAAHRRRPPHGGRRPCRRPALRRPGLEPHRRAARRGRASAGWRRSRSASSPAAAARATSSATPTSSRGSSGPTTTSSRSRRRAWCPRSTARSPR